MAKQVTIALYGCGTVGGGVMQFLQSNKQEVNRRIGAGVNLRYVVDTRLDELAGNPLLEGTELISDTERPINDPEVDLIVELIGGTDIACDVVESALNAGKDVVTANKALLAEKSGELFALARRNNVSIAFEASVAGGIPIVAALRDSFIGEPIGSVYGIVNGTCNYILTRMGTAGISYESALSEAQERGYAEADPTLDVEGDDSAHKLAILARLAFGVDVKSEAVFCQGISEMNPLDILYADSLGYKVKLLAIGKKEDNSVQLGVHPALLQKTHPLAEVNGSLNAVCLHGSEVGEVTMTGLGAGERPTASAVVADICRLARGVYQEDFLSLPIFGDCSKSSILSQEEIESRYYFRLNCIDRAGVLAGVAGVLGKYGISIASCIQQDRAPREGRHVPVVFMTHMVKEKNMMDALNEINALEYIQGKESAVFRVADV